MTHMTRIGTARKVAALCGLLALSNCVDHRAAASVAPDLGICRSDDLRVLASRVGLPGPCSARLRPDEKVVLQIAPYTALEIRANRPLHVEDLQVGVSNGTGVIGFPELFPVNGALVLPARSDAAVLHIARPPAARDDLRVRFLVSGSSGTSDLRVRNLRSLEIPGDEFTVIETEDQDTAFTLLPAMGSTRLSVVGPATLALQTRSLFAGGSEWLKTYRVETALDGVPHIVLEYEAAPDADARVEGNPSHAVGSPQTEYIAIPEGRHLLDLKTSEQLLARLTVNATSQKMLLRSSWDLSPAQVGDLGAFACSSAGDLERVARRTARDNERLGGTLTAVEQLRSIAAGRADRRQLDAAASRLENAYSYFRDLVPNSPAGLHQEIAYVDELQISQADLARATGAIEALSTPVLLDRLLRAVFVSAPKAGHPLVYLPPPREAVSEVRLIVDQTALRAPVGVFVSFDDSAPVRLLVLPESELAQAALSPSPALRGLQRLAKTAGVDFGEVTRTDAFAIYQIPGRLLKAGTIRLPLPTNSKAIRIWVDDPSRQDVRLALQYRAAATPTLGDAAYEAEIVTIGPDAARGLFYDAVRTAVTCPQWLEQPGSCPLVRRIQGPGPVSNDELYNTWIPLLRLIRARERALFGSLPPERRIAPVADAAADEARLTRLISLAEQASRAGRMHAALEHWTEIASIAGGETWAQSQLKRAELLSGLGESFLAERFLKNLYLTTNNVSYRRAAYQRLLDRYRAEGATDAVLGLEVAELSRDFTVHGLEHLATALEADGEDEKVTIVASLLSPARAVMFRDALLRAGWNAASRPANSTTNSQPVWRNAEHLVSSSAGAMNYLAPARGTYGRFYQAAPGQPLLLNVDGPVRLQISARPLHEAAGKDPLEGWFSLTVNNQQIWVPVTTNHEATGIDLFGTSARAGTAVEEVIDLPAGSHTVAVGTENTRLLVEARTANPLALAQPGQLTPGQHISQLLRSFEMAQGDRRDFLVSAARLNEQHGADPAVALVWQRFLRQAHWERLSTFDRSAGTRTVDMAMPQAENPALRTRLALLPPLNPAERFLSAAAETTFALVNPEPTVVDGMLVLESVATLQSPPVTVRYQLDSEKPKTVTLAQDNAAQQFYLAVPKGEHVVRFSVLSSHANQFVRLRLREAGGPLVEDAGTRRFEVSTPEEPAQLTLEGPTWLRIHEYRDGETSISYRAVERGLQTVPLAPREGQVQMLLRVFQLVPDDKADGNAMPDAPAPSLAAPAERVPHTTGTGRVLPICSAGSRLPADHQDLRQARRG